MSQVKIQGNASGTGSLTLAAPNTNSDLTLNLPSTLGNTGTGAFATTDSSGNLGLGVTPSAWSGSYKAFEMGTGTALMSYTGTTPGFELGSNSYFNGTNYIYKINGKAGQYVINNGVHSWGVSASGTAGNAITFTQAMTLDASGNLSIGVTSASAPLHVRKDQTAATYIMADNNGTVNASTSAGFACAEGGSVQAFFRSLRDGGGEAQLYNVANAALRFGTNNTERARIDPSGNLLVGTTSTLGKLGVSNSGNSTNARFDNGSASITGRNVWSTYTGSGNNNTTAIHFAAYDGSVGSDVFQVLGNGNVRNQNNSYGAISDLKLKENVVDATPKLSGLMQVRIVNYNLKTDPERKQLGVIAQELEQVFPGMVEESPDLDMEGNDLETTTKSVKYSVFVPMLIKAIQEQQAIIQTLTDRITALEAK